VAKQPKGFLTIGFLSVGLLILAETTVNLNKPSR